MSLPQHIIKELEEAFFLFDYDKDKKITSREVGAVVRSVGLNPTEAELKEMINDVNAKGGKVDVPTLSQIIPRKMPEMQTTPDHLRDAFQVFDKQGNGTVTLGDLKHSLTTLGERLTDEEMDELIRVVDADGEGQANYEDIVSELLADSRK